MSSFAFRFLAWSDQKVVDEINALMKSLHSKSKTLTVDNLILILNRYVVVVAELDERIVGVAMMDQMNKLSLWGDGSIHTMYTSVEDSQVDEVLSGLVSRLVSRAEQDGCFRVDVSFGLNRPQAQAIRRALEKQGFREKPATRLRLSLDRPKT